MQNFQSDSSDCSRTSSMEELSDILPSCNMTSSNMTSSNSASARKLNSSKLLNSNTSESILGKRSSDSVKGNFASAIEIKSRNVSNKYSPSTPLDISITTNKNTSSLKKKASKNLPSLGDSAHNGLKNSCLSKKNIPSSTLDSRRLAGKVVTNIQYDQVNML